MVSANFCAVGNPALRRAAINLLLALRYIADFVIVLDS